MKNQIIYLIKNMLFVVYIACFVCFSPSIINKDTYSLLFIIISSLYIVFEIIIFIIKNEELNKNLMNNISSVLLYIYILIMTIKINTVTPMNDNFYINYILASIATISIIISSVLIMKKKETKN